LAHAVSPCHCEVIVRGNLTFLGGVGCAHQFPIFSPTFHVGLFSPPNLVRRSCGGLFGVSNHQVSEKIGQFKLQAPDGYVKDMRRRDPELGKGWGQIAIPLVIETEGGPQPMRCLISNACPDVGAQRRSRCFLSGPLIGI
jgi:hypothetical protein